MSRTRIPDHLIHKPEDVERNAKLFDKFVEMVPEDAYVSLITLMRSRDESTMTILARIQSELLAIKFLFNKLGFLRGSYVLITCLFSSSVEKEKAKAEELLDSSQMTRELLVSTWLTIVGFVDPVEKPLPENFFAILADSLSNAAFCEMTEEDAKAAFDICKKHLETKKGA